MCYTLLASMIENVGASLHDILWFISRLIRRCHGAGICVEVLLYKASSPVAYTAWTRSATSFHLVKRSIQSETVKMSFNMDHLASIPLDSPQILAWSIFSKGFGFVSGPFIWPFVVALLVGFVVAKTQQQKAFRDLCDEAGNMIPDGPRPLPVLGKILSRIMIRDTYQRLETEQPIRILPISDQVP